MASSKNFIILIISILWVNLSLFGQKIDTITNHSKPTAPPILLEPFIGTRGVSVFTLFSKPLTQQSKFGIFSLAEYYGTYKTEDQKLKNQYVAQTLLTYEIVKNFKLTVAELEATLNRDDVQEWNYATAHIYPKYVLLYEAYTKAQSVITNKETLDSERK